MLVRSLRAQALPLERVSSTAEHKVLECLNELQAGSILHGSASTNSTNSTTSSSSNSSSSDGTLSSLLMDTRTNTEALAALYRPAAAGGSNHAPRSDAPLWEAVRGVDSSSSSSSLTSSSSSSDTSFHGALFQPDLQVDIRSSRACGLQQQQQQHRQQEPQQGQGQGQGHSSAQECRQGAGKARPLASRSWGWGWGWRWPSCSCGMDSFKDKNASSSSSSSSGVSSSSNDILGRLSNVEQSLAGMVGGSRVWHEGGLASAAGSGCLHPAVQAHLQGNLAFAFSGGGFRYTYFIGVMDVLYHQLGLIAPHALLSGASSGSLIAVLTRCGLPVEKVLELTRSFTHDCASHGVRGRLGVVLGSYLDAYLPDDAHELCEGNTFLAITRVWPMIQTRLVSSFKSRSDLIRAVLASCHLPTLSDGSLTVKFKGRLHIDGGLLSVVTPPPGAAHTVLVCSMPSAQIARLPAFISRPRGSDIAISPDSFQEWPFSRSQTTALALDPPGPAFIEHMVERGRQDALAWAEAVGFTRNGCPLFPTAQQADTMQRTLFAPSWLCAESFWHLQPDRCQSETSHTVSGLLPK